MIFIDSYDWGLLLKKFYLGEVYGDCRVDICIISFKYFIFIDLKLIKRKFF